MEFKETLNIVEIYDAAPARAVALLVSLYVQKYLGKLIDDGTPATKCKQRMACTKTYKNKKSPVTVESKNNGKEKFEKKTCQHV